MSSCRSKTRRREWIAVSRKRPRQRFDPGATISSGPTNDPVKGPTQSREKVTRRTELEIDSLESRLDIGLLPAIEQPVKFVLNGGADRRENISLPGLMPHDKRARRFRTGLDHVAIERQTCKTAHLLHDRLCVREQALEANYDHLGHAKQAT